ncbi:hypothetical protein [Shewanella sp. KCT]|uniref:hypothetical protein n=1 Tax=Shewanella sp. KCT TaxID=2569535 RepID=UPI0011845C7C|nr:hypothetical protein [Shewanella sp. KCT]
MINTSTTPPYANTSSSSTATPAQNYIQPQSPALPSGSSHSFDFNSWGVLLVSMALTGVIGYFSSLISVKTDIAENKKEISVAVEKIKSIESDVSDVKSSVLSVNTLERKVDVLDVKLQHLEKAIDKQSESIAENAKGISSKVSKG